ncbi:helicase SNF [Paenibacillus lycopersici]|uniref:Helicase SNF n=1 Tax=Paenibacillus lycopersici TaxID=2704462 RepID=A0A6C0FSJ6_9BACL|nr:DEAD/DEAH box helicase [Paenibacillus lycopersici]QHT59052.1 helicase SNF [Paenibacillus lycopersici]
MNPTLTLSAIQSMCGQLSYKRGESAFRGGKVAVTYYDADAGRCEATVRLQEDFEVALRIDEDGDVTAKCSCPSLSSYAKYCSHIAAVLLLIHDAQQGGKAPGGKADAGGGRGGRAGSGADARSARGSRDDALREGELARSGADDRGARGSRDGALREGEPAGSGADDRGTRGSRDDALREGELAGSGADDRGARGSRDGALREGELAGSGADDRGARGSRDDAGDRLARGLLELFAPVPRAVPASQTRFDTRELLPLAFVCKPFAYGSGGRLLGVELKAGAKRPVSIPDIRRFLRSLTDGEPCAIAKSLEYDPKRHCFSPADYAVLEQLIAIAEQERLYRDTSGVYSAYAAPMSGERMLLVPPPAWEAFLPALIGAPSASIELDNVVYATLTLSDERLPLQFELEEQTAGTGCRLRMPGLMELAVFDAYGLVLAEGKILRQPQEACRRLLELQDLLREAGTGEADDAAEDDRLQAQSLPLPPAQIETFMERAMPGLLKLGPVRIADEVASRITQRPLKARLYLDRIRDRLLAALEFHYGDLVINPLEPERERGIGGPILMRDGERERQILALMEGASFAKTEAGYFLGDEEREYHFLQHVVPQLEKLLTVHATSAVRTRILVGSTPPSVALTLNERTNWLDVKFDIAGIPESEIKAVLKAIEEKRRYHRLPTGALLPLDTDEMKEIIRFINEGRLTAKDLRASGIRIPLFRGLHLMDVPRQGGAVKLDKAFRRLLDNLRNPDNLDFPEPPGLLHPLRDYQAYGYQWMRTLAHYGFGGILADDMGLGKTVQAIAFLSSMLPQIREERLPAVIVAPASLTYNWRNEIRKFAPHIRAVIADGTKAQRHAALAGSSSVDVVITSYPLLRRDVVEYAARSFHTLILDEAQAFKNDTTQTAQSVKLLQARNRFALTGTPVENRIEELRSLFDAVCPDLFPGRKAFGELAREAIAKRARPFLLRRVKADVLKELPDKIESVQASALLPEQKKLYAAYLAKLREETLRHLDRETLNKNRIRILAGLTRLRQMCCHPALFVEDYAGSSGKFQQLLELIEECRSAGRRMLVFSQFVEMLKLIRQELHLRNVPYFYLDGSTPPQERTELSSRFNEGEGDLFLISLKAGGTGLNLTGADTVILYDLWWNPAVEQQAADRAHRIGQKNVVQVIRLVAEGTVEDKMVELQERKKHLIDEVIQPGEEPLSALTEDEIKELLMLT